MPFVLEPDDEVRRFQPVYLGPAPKTLPWHARNSSYFVFGAIFGTYLLILWLVPSWEVGVPIFPAGYSVIATYLIQSAVDHDKPVVAVFQNLWNVARAPRPRQDRTAVRRRPALHRRTKTTREPLSS